MRIPTQIGDTFGRMKVLSIEKEPESTGGDSVKRAECQCDCGNVKKVRLSHLRAGKIVSCGCWKNEKASERCRPVKPGDKFKMLMVIQELPRTRVKDGASVRMFLFKCDCGNEKILQLSTVANGNTHSCGCYNVAINTLKATTHGMSKTPTYKAWIGMMKRCRGGNKHAPRYFDRDIRVCKRWHRFENFLEDMGEKPDGPRTSLDRKNNSGNYTKSNCRWADDFIQSNNKRNNRRIKFKGRYFTIAQASKEFKIPYSRLLSRLNSGWSITKSLTA